MAHEKYGWHKCKCSIPYSLPTSSTSVTFSCMTTIVVWSQHTCHVTGLRYQTYLSGKSISCRLEVHFALAHWVSHQPASTKSLTICTSMKWHKALYEEHMHMLKCYMVDCHWLLLVCFRWIDVLQKAVRGETGEELGSEPAKDRKIDSQSPEHETWTL